MDEKLSLDGPRRILVAMMGARRHYAVPRILQRGGRLERFYTDICSVQGWPKLLTHVPSKWQPRPLQRLSARIPTDIPIEKITSYPSFGLMNAFRLSRAKSMGERLSAFTNAAIELSKRIARNGFGAADAVYTFDRAGFELMTAAKKRGLYAIMEQTVAPFRVNQELLSAEQERFPEWYAYDKSSAQGFNWFREREEAEWELADLILCGSEYVKDRIVSCGGSRRSCAVVPYGVDARLRAIPRGRHDGPLRVLTIGAVGLRKGSPYTLEAAKRLVGRAVFRLVGPMEATPAAEGLLRQYVELTGQVPRSHIAEHYQWADVFLLPSLNEGSAAVVYEALSAGLPVICTSNTGSVVRDGLDGFIVPVRDSVAICDRLDKLACDVGIRERMSSHARQRAADFTLDRYGQRLLDTLDSVGSVPR